MRRDVSCRGVVKCHRKRSCGEKAFTSVRGWPVCIRAEEVTPRSQDCPQPWGQGPNKCCWQIDCSKREPPTRFGGVLRGALPRPQGHFVSWFKWTQLLDLMAASAQQGMWLQVAGAWFSGNRTAAQSMCFFFFFQVDWLWTQVFSTGGVRIVFMQHFKNSSNGPKTFSSLTS